MGFPKIRAKVSQRGSARAPHQPTVGELRTELDIERFHARVTVASTVQLEQDLAEDMSRDGLVVITKMHCDTHDGVEEMARIFRMRRLLDSVLARIPDCLVVKTAGSRYFLFCNSVKSALVTAAAVQHAVQKENASQAAHLHFGLSVGICEGKALLPPRDMYGDPVNIASKLGEDVAVSGEVLVADNVAQQLDSVSLPPEVKVDNTDPRTIKVSGVELQFANVTLSIHSKTKKNATQAKWLSELFTALKNTHVPNPTQLKNRSLEELVLVLENYKKYKVLETSCRTALGCHVRQLTVLTTDLSGFTRTVREHGILHFMKLIVMQRCLLRPIIERNHGTIFKFEGDNVFAVFNAPENAMKASLEGLLAIQQFNERQDDDLYYIIVKMGVHTGEMYFHDGREMYGEAAELGEWLAEDVGVKMAVQCSDAVYQCLDAGTQQIAVVESDEFHGKKTNRYIFNVEQVKSSTRKASTTAS